MRVLVFANGDIEDGPVIQDALKTGAEATVVAADGGARIAQHFGRHIDVLIGDMDSLAAEAVEGIANEGAHVRRFPPEKDETDLELALQWAAEQDSRWIRVIGAAGGRLDQVIANLYLMALPRLVGCDVRMVMARQEAYLIRPGESTVLGAAGDTISLIPVDGPARGVRTENLYYPLHGETLEFGPARGLSNVMQAGTAQISLDEGLLLLVHTIGRA